MCLYFEGFKRELVENYNDCFFKFIIGQERKKIVLIDAARGFLRKPIAVRLLFQTVRCQGLAYKS